ncbi:hypothetical protein BC936DRAFT_145589 [Jimgerdemannia flammicorona]|uniref:Uncharacterized protein n=2 Tax=Jimgerdemannia flammicorona TaxID=994334 RepID=A0A433D9M4_9FUNG|nr:hypothetical protein BC936DRAFT_145589 [Jimgerdemannia flammicorona]RUS34467.1 hypothetical protein BC938DRAFT_480217 [Jimgerdemannia flammicorona]
MTLPIHTDTLHTHHATTSYTFCFYVSGHGWGHATRACQVIFDILRLPAGHRVYVVSNASEFIFRGVTDRGAVYRHALIDAGVVQPLAYTVDREKTIENLTEFLRHREEKLAREMVWLRSVGADCVLCDSPFLPCAAASAVGIPAAIVSNFTFDEVYLGLCENDALDPTINTIVHTIISDYKKADLLIRLPGAIRIPSFESSPTLVPITPITAPNTLLPVFPVTTTSLIPTTTLLPRLIIDIPLVFRHSVTPRSAVLDGLAIPTAIYTTHKILLLTFGGQIIDNEEWGDPLPPGWICIVCGAPDYGELPPRFYRASRDAYVPDLVNACDVVLGKLGYGTCSECIGHARPFIYVPRPQFIEEYGLLELMRSQGSCVELTREKFEGGEWKEAILEACAMPGRCDEAKRIAHDGGVVAARVLCEFVRERRGENVVDGKGVEEVDIIVDVTRGVEMFGEVVN